MPSDTNILVAIRPATYLEVFTDDADARLRQLGEVIYQDSEQNLSSAELAARIRNFSIVVTGWGTPTFTDEVLNAAPDLQLIAHSAGSIRKMLPPPVFERGIQVTHAAAAIAPAVADLTLLLIMTMLRRVYQADRMLHGSGAWNEAKPPMGEEIAGQRIGVVGAGYTGQQVIALLQAVGARVWVCDPYLSEARAVQLNVHKADLDDLFASCRVVTLQAPVTEETMRMVGGRQLQLLQDDGIFINTARGLLVDQAALRSELESGRIRAALDVFDPEPLPPDDPLRRLDNVFLTPHIAGASRQARFRQGSAMVDEIERFLKGEPLHYPVTQDMLAIMA
jgi:phosphoglycerate dehydrogenase-like enzyme